MEANPKIEFGTDGWRGILNEEVNTRTVASVAQAYAEYIRERFQKPAIAVGFDSRNQSAEFAEIFAHVAAANGVGVLLSDGIVPTPVLSFTVKDRGLAGGVMITASHNPPEYNGVKFKGPFGGPLFTEETASVERLLNRSSPKTSGGAFERLSFLPRYVEQIEGLIDFDTISRAGLTVAIDSMHGAGGELLQSLLARRGCTATTVSDNPLADFGGRTPEPLSKNLEPLKSLVQTIGASIGVATDGDADRLGIVTERGDWLGAQEMILLLAQYVAGSRQLPGAFVKTSSVTEKMQLVANEYLRELVEVQVGFKYICEAMLAQPVAFGAEESGGMGYGFHIPERDGILSALLMIEMIASSGATNIGDLRMRLERKYGQIFYDRRDVHYGDVQPLGVLKSARGDIPSALKMGSPIKVQTYSNSRGAVNGVKWKFGAGARWLLVRVSETEPLVRMYAEGETATETLTLLDAAQVFFDKTLGCRGKVK